MKTYTTEQLAEIIAKHGKWLREEDGGEMANLAGANLTWANLTWAKLPGVTGHHYITQRSDGYQFFLVLDGEKWFIRAGCRYMSITDYRLHTAGYNDNAKAIETNLILNFAEAILNSKS